MKKNKSFIRRVFIGIKFRIISSFYAFIFGLISRQHLLKLYRIMERQTKTKRDAFSFIRRFGLRRIQAEEKRKISEFEKAVFFGISRGVYRANKELDKVVCRHRAILISMMLKKRGLRSTVTFGVGVASDKVEGHCWISSESGIVFFNGDDPSKYYTFTRFN